MSTSQATTITPVSQAGTLRMAVAGAGAIGCTVAAMLAQGGQRVSLLARGATLDAVRKNGLRLHRGKDSSQTIIASVTVSDSAADLGIQDAIFICTKAHDLATIAATLQPLIGPETCIIPMVNGVPWWYFQALPGRMAGRQVHSVDPDGRLLQLLPANQVIGAVQFLTAERLAPGVASSTNHMLVILGEIDHTETPRAARLVQALNAAGIESRLNPRIRDPLWTKIIANLSSNPLSVLTGATLDTLYSDPRLLPIVRKIMNECLALAASYGARIDFDPSSFIEQAQGMGPVRTSMLQDALSGHRLELAAIGDAVLELAQLQGMPMPVTSDILAMTHYRDDAGRAPATSA
ncbi:2-dehydropantoate 2-reductase [Pusillimonas sp. (ex Stolz et al. 2005)]|uniref:ketopantoate reductase family protein n=1 Tax=Pusillimonas sp. (ex Stolz et al. 2005) TaxID=1979962 RepID=UPI0026367A05|nr:2-dehydropantoate 2-reductase [Pusillimonas sp. (ex Stolz et al. 2005)]